MITIITTCKNRLPHLKQTLPLMLSQSFREVIVVDYGCEQGTADWVSKRFPEARVIEVNDDPGFCAARARNIGAKHAQNDFLLFIDADTLLNVDLGKWLKANLQPGCYYVSKDCDVLPDLWGFLICDRNSFNSIHGYDEAYREWGGEDVDLEERLKPLGLKMLSVPRGWLTPIPHGDDLRQLDKNDLPNSDVRNQMATLNKCYRLIKSDIQKVLRQEIDLDMRKTIRKVLFEERTRALSEGRRDISLTIDVPSEFRQIQRKLVYNIHI